MATAVDTPIMCTSVPFRIAGGSAVMVEQDSPVEIDQCVDAVLRTPLGSLDDAPNLGVPQILFGHGGAAAPIAAAIRQCEPRADEAVTEDLSQLAQRIDRVVVESKAATGG